jgi:hypothetical protein
MATFTPKRLIVNGSPVKFIQSSLRIISGYGEVNVRTQVSGRNVEVVPAEDLDTAIGGIDVDLIVTDSSSNSDIRKTIRAWKQNIGANTIFIEPDGAGTPQKFIKQSLINEIEFNEAPDGVVSLQFRGPQVQLN